MSPSGLAVLAALLTGCASGAATGASPPPSPTATASPATPSPTVGPGPRRIDITATGLGSYLETTVPVAILRSASAGEVATEVTVHLQVLTPAGRGVAAADVGVSAIPPGSSVVVTARVAGALRGDRVAAAVTVRAWTDAASAALPTLTAAAAAPVCPGCGRGGSGTVAVAVGGDTQAGLVQVGAACRDAAGRIVGGGSALHPAGPAPLTVAVPIILSEPATSCAEVSAVAGVF